MKFQAKDQGLHSKQHNSIKFIHASDIHLGCAQYQNEYRADDFITAFKQVLYLGIKNSVDFIILAGDVFTSIDILPEKLLQIIKLLEKFHKRTNNIIPIIAIEGNHDLRRYSRGLKTERTQSWLKLMNHLGLMILLQACENGDKRQKLEFQEYNSKSKIGNLLKIRFANIFGTSYRGERPESHILNLYNSIEKKEDEFNILLQHFGIAGQMDNVPGLNLCVVNKLSNKVDYLALGHFHLQYTIGGWIYNPGSTEAACSVDSLFNRGVFFVEVFKDANGFSKRVKSIKLINREILWKTICLPFQFKEKNKFFEYLLSQLSLYLKDFRNELKPTNYQLPLLYLKIIGIKPVKTCKITKKEIRKLICGSFSILDARIYFEYNRASKSIVQYL
jgi:DNA repair exonuclease SbcCD nuclease subunit